MHSSSRGTASPREVSVLCNGFHRLSQGWAGRMTNTYEPYLFTDTWSCHDRAWLTFVVGQALLRSVAIRRVG